MTADYDVALRAGTIVAIATLLVLGETTVSWVVVGQVANFVALVLVASPFLRRVYLASRISSDSRDLLAELETLEDFFELPEAITSRVYELIIEFHDGNNQRLVIPDPITLEEQRRQIEDWLMEHYGETRERAYMKLRNIDRMARVNPFELASTAVAGVAIGFVGLVLQIAGG